VEPAFDASLDRLRLDYLDLYLIHTPFGFQLGDEQDPRDRDGNLLYARRDLAQYMEGAAGVPSDEGIDRYLRPIVAILFLWLNQHISFATKVA
jgi:hypothetical protein